MNNQEKHLTNEGQRIGNELRHHEFTQVHKELSHAIHAGSKSFEHVLKGIREGLRGEQSFLSVERDQNNELTHINFENHNVYGGKPTQAHAGHNTGREDAAERNSAPIRHNHTVHIHDVSEHFGKKADRAGIQHAHHAPGSDASDSQNSSHGHENTHNQELQAMVDLVKRLGKEMGLSRAATTGAVAAMLEESGGNPLRVGDHGASVGLFQLNFRGGEGTESGISKQEAKNPETNARIALKYFKDAQHRSSNPIEIAKLAQRAGDRKYVQSVGQRLREAENLVGDEYV
jgi:hypothetical protein